MDPYRDVGGTTPRTGKVESSLEKRPRATQEAKAEDETITILVSYAASGRQLVPLVLCYLTGGTLRSLQIFLASVSLISE